MKRLFYTYQQAYQLFCSVRHNDKDGFSVNKALRQVCRYHCLIVYRDWDIRYGFQHPTSRTAFIRLCDSTIKEMESVYQDGLFDNIGHYLQCHHLLLLLRLYARKYPILWNVSFLLSKKHNEQHYQTS